MCLRGKQNDVIIIQKRKKKGREGEREGEKSARKEDETERERRKGRKRERERKQRREKSVPVQTLQTEVTVHNRVHLAGDTPCVRRLPLTSASLLPQSFHST